MCLWALFLVLVCVPPFALAGDEAAVPHHLGAAQGISKKSKMTFSFRSGICVAYTLFQAQL